MEAVVQSIQTNTRVKKRQLKAAVEDLSFTCGAPLQDLDLPGRLNDVYTRQLPGAYAGFESGA